MALVDVWVIHHPRAVARRNFGVIMVFSNPVHHTRYHPPNMSRRHPLPLPLSSSSSSLLSRKPLSSSWLNLLSLPLPSSAILPMVSCRAIVSEEKSPKPSSNSSSPSRLSAPFALSRRPPSKLCIREKRPCAKALESGDDGRTLYVE